jgi:hypothetical protein
MDIKLSPAAEKLMKEMLKGSKDVYIPDLN